MRATPVANGVTISAPEHGLTGKVLSSDALAFLSELHRRFEPTRRKLLEARIQRYARITAGENPTFRADTQHIRDNASWKVSAPPEDLKDRRVEITGPTDRKMVINALNSGAK